LRINKDFRMKFFQEREKIKVLQEKELEAYLGRLGLLEGVTIGKAKCLICGTVLGLETIQAIVPKGDRVVLVCTNPKCLKQVDLT
jgi:hypothetical protein